MTHGGPQASDKYSLGSHVVRVSGAGRQGLRRRSSPNYRGSTGYGDAFLRDMVGHYFQNAHLDVMTGVDELIQPRHRRSRPDGEDGLERRRPHDEQDHHVHRSLQGGVGRARARRTGCRCTRRATCARSARRGSAARRGRRTRRSIVYWANSPLKDVANVKTPTLFFVGERDPARADAAVGGDVPRAEEPSACRRTSTSRRASRTAGASCGTSCSS